jgi:hypothetical protein
MKLRLSLKIPNPQFNVSGMPYAAFGSPRVSRKLL